MAGNYSCIVLFQARGGRCYNFANVIFRLKKNNTHTVLLQVDDATDVFAFCPPTVNCLSGSQTTRSAS